MVEVLTPNDLIVFSHLPAVISLSYCANKAGLLWASTFAIAAVASSCFHAAETTKHVLGSHDLPGASWAKELQPHEVTLLWVDRVTVFAAFITTARVRGGVVEAVAELWS
eukprot:5164667-Amphidinium_carterae.1